MRKRRLVLILFVVGLLVGLTCRFLLRQSEPEQPAYAGRPLSEWLEKAGSIYDNDLTVGGAKPSDAVHQIGTNALPFLLTWIKYEGTPQWKLSFTKWSFKIKRFLSEGTIDGEPAHVLTREERLHGAAMAGFAALGPEAKGAVPKLSRMIAPPKHADALFDVPTDVMRALACIGEAGFPPVMAALTNRDTRIAACAAANIYLFGTNAHPAVPVLVKYLGGTNDALAAGAAWSLAKLQLEPNLVVPALARSLRHSCFSVRLNAIFGLARFGRDAQPAVPQLLPVLSDPHPTLRKSATNALFRIAPEILTNSSSK
jgi:hypothetical protein